MNKAHQMLDLAAEFERRAKTPTNGATTQEFLLAAAALRLAAQADVPQSPNTTEVSEDMLLAAMQALVNEEWHPPQPLSSFNGFDQRRYRRLATVVLNAGLAVTRPNGNSQ
jgi:hypothetical protein